VRDMRGGKDYDSDFSKRMKGEGVWADLLRQRFRQTVKRLGLNERTNGILDLSQFRGVPATVAPVSRVAVRSADAKPRDDMQLNLF
ncbi:MAG: radical SAM protein, partial [Burkholderia sp.]|nr:radical SAM protein [Burkholderia sp.]